MLLPVTESLPKAMKLFTRHQLGLTSGTELHADGELFKLSRRHQPALRVQAHLEGCG